MDLDWHRIKVEIKREIGDVFVRSTPRFMNLEDGVELLRKVVFSDVCRFQLGGLMRTLPHALQEAYTDKVGEIGPLRIIADNLEPFLKKVGIIANIDTQDSLLRMDLMPLIKLLQINNALSNQSRGGYPQLTEQNQASFIGQPEYLEFICDAYLTRNKVHEAPDWNRVTVLQKTSNLLVVYIYACFKFQSQINAASISTPSESIRNKISGEQEYLYHFISFGETTNKIRNQIVNSYVLNFLKGNPGVRIEEVRTRVNEFFANEMPMNYYQSLIIKMRQESRIVIDATTKGIELSVEEFERIGLIQKRFEDNRDIFFLYLGDIASKYEISHAISELFDKLQQFIESNYNIDIAEAYGRGEVVETDQNQAFQAFIQFLQSITTDRVTANCLFRELIILARDSDFLVRMCASKTFAKLTNPDRFEQYLHQQEKIVYLDTQIILFALCLNYVPTAGYENVYYTTTEELVKLAGKNPSIKLKVSRLYLQEVTFQLRLALLLIPFEDVTKAKFSSNIFFQFYWHLKENGLLAEGDDSFGEFMAGWLRLYEEDVYDRDFGTIVFSNLYNFLMELNIEIETLPNYENRDDVVSLLTEVLDSEKYKSRPKNVKANDALMMCHLCNPELHSVEPFFLTWDKSFTKFRKVYIEKYKRSNLISFHLFNPARFLNHYSLIRLKINPQAITNDFLSILDSFEIHENTQTVWDAVNRFLNIENMTLVKRKRYILIMKELFEGELNYTVDDLEDVEKTQRVLVPFEDVLSKINEYYNNHPSLKALDYRNLILEEEYFDQVSKLILQTIHESKNELDLFATLDSLIAKQKNKDIHNQ